MNHTTIVLGTFFCLMPALLAAQDEQSKSDKPGLQQLAWLAGGWRAESKTGASSEEHWIAPKAGLMLGVNRSVRRGRASFEFLRIQQTTEGITYYASPGGRKPTPFKLTSAKNKTAVFENPKHDFPQKIVYRLEKDTLHARIEGKIGGKPRAMSWKWKRMPARR